VGPQHQQQHQHQQRGREPSGAVGVVSEMDAGNVRRREDREEDEEIIVMSSTAYPGQEWAPSNYGHWEDD